MEHQLIHEFRKILKRLLRQLRSYDESPNASKRIRILDTFEVISSFKTSIRSNVDEIDPVLGYRLKRKLITFFDQCISAFVHQRDFDLEIKAVRNSLEQTITIEEVQILSDQDSVHLKSDSQQDTSQQIDSTKDKHPSYNPNLWDKTAYELFKYLYDNYYCQGKKTKRKLTNIWFYLREYDSPKYVLKATKDLYKDFVKKKYKVDIRNFDKAPQKYNDTEYISLNDHRINFESIGKHVKNT
jgi:hypothetical protein